jgi:carboxylesterase
LTQETLQGAGPFYFKGNKTAILMIPGGGGGTCADLKYIADDIHNKTGYTIHIPLLPGFGTSPKDLKNTQIVAWKNALKEEIQLLEKKCDKLIVGGHSMGGVLALILASKHILDGIFTLSAPIGIKGIGPKLVPLLKIFIKYYHIDSVKFKKETNNKWVGYDKIPLNQATKMKKLIKQMKQILPNIRCPALLFQGRLDSVIKTNSMDFIFEKIGSIIKKELWLENNDHPILESPDHDIIVSELINFVKEI